MLSVHTAWAYTWDVVEGNAAADAAAVGLDALVVAAAYHSVRAYAPRLRDRRVVTANAGVYFTPDSTLYGEIHPVVAADDAFDRSLESAREAGLEARAWVVLTHSTALGLRHPDHVVVNAFGDRYAYALCPSSAAVQEYASALVADVAARGVLSVDLEAFAAPGYNHGSHHDKPRADLSVAASALLSLCFCRACTTSYGAAEIDVERLQMETRLAIDREIAGPSMRTAEAALAAVAGGAEATHIRDAAALALLESVRRRTDVQLYALGGPAAHVDGVIVPLYGLDPVEAADALGGWDRPITAGIRFVAPDAALVQPLVDAAVSAGAEAFRYYHFGLATAEEVNALTTVVRRR